MNENWTIIDTLRYTRHDWLNRLQMIKGNIALGKIDQAERIIDEIVLEMQQEALLTNLQLPLFAEQLLLHNWKGYRFTIEYEIIRKTKTMNLNDQQLAHWITHLFQSLHHVSLPAYDNHLYITMNLTDQQTRFLLQFNGIIESKDELEQKLTYEQSDLAKTSFQQVAPNEWLFEAVFE